MPTFSIKSSAICVFVLWIAGTTICDGVSPASWMIHSPRSVSIGSIPSCLESFVQVDLFGDHALGLDDIGSTAILYQVENNPTGL